VGCKVKLQKEAGCLSSFPGSLPANDLGKLFGEDAWATFVDQIGVIHMFMGCLVSIGGAF
jgi:hypothetical protein